MSLTFSLSQLLAVAAPILTQSSNLPWPDFSGVPLDFHAVISPARGTVCGFCCWVGWRSGNKPLALLFRSGLPGNVSAVCWSEQLSSLGGNGRLFVFSAIWAIPIFSWNPMCIRELCSLEWVWEVHCNRAWNYGLPIQDRWEGLYRTTSSINMFFQWFKECEFESGLP